MRFFKKDKDKKKQHVQSHSQSHDIADHQLSKYSNQVQQNFRNNTSPLYLPSRASTFLLENLPKDVLPRIFAFVCPHTQDETYETCETSAIFDACMLCDLRDLASCARVSWKWNSVANAAL